MQGMKSTWIYLHNLKLIARLYHETELEENMYSSDQVDLNLI